MFTYSTSSTSVLKKCFTSILSPLRNAMLPNSSSVVQIGLIVCAVCCSSLPPRWRPTLLADVGFRLVETTFCPLWAFRHEESHCPLLRDFYTWMRSAVSHGPFRITHAEVRLPVLVEISFIVIKVSVVIDVWPLVSTCCVPCESLTVKFSCHDSVCTLAVDLHILYRAPSPCNRLRACLQNLRCKRVAVDVGCFTPYTDTAVFHIVRIYYPNVFFVFSHFFYLYVSL